MRVFFFEFASKKLNLNKLLKILVYNLIKNYKKLKKNYFCNFKLKQSFIGRTSV